MKKIDKYDFLDVVKSLILILVLNVLFVLIFAFVLQFVDLNSKTISIINISLRYLAIMIGIFYAYKSLKNGAVKGVFIGVFYNAIMLIIYAIVNKKFSLNVYSLIDIGCLIIVSVVCSVAAVNFKKPKIVKNAQY